MGIFLSKTLIKEAEPEREKYEPSKDKFDPNKVQRGNVPKTVKNGESRNPSLSRTRSFLGSTLTRVQAQATCPRQ